MNTMQVNERPIIFSGEMVLAILDGHKMQTRRVVNPQPNDAWARDANIARVTNDEYFWASGDCISELKCHFWVGRRLWVRETFSLIWTEYEPCWEEDETIRDVPHQIHYRADTDDKYPSEWPADMGDDPECPKWRPSIHMPRWASRITLEITDVRVERVQDISDDDAKAEGSKFGNAMWPSDRTTFELLWDSLNAKRGFGWETNPWVWVIAFKRIET